MSSSDDATTRRWNRERTARKRAEELLEQKSLELFRVNEQLRSLNVELEERVRQRTVELQVTQFAVDHAGASLSVTAAIVALTMLPALTVIVLNRTERATDVGLMDE